MSATRTLPSSWRARPFELPLASDIRSSVNELLADVQDSLENCEPGGRAEQVDRPLEAPPRREDRADDEDRRAEPVEKELVPALERNEHGRREAERDAGRGERVRRDPRAGKGLDRAARKGAGAGRVPVLDPARAWCRRFVHRVHADRLGLEVY